MSIDLIVALLAMVVAVAAVLLALAARAAGRGHTAEQADLRQTRDALRAQVEQAERRHVELQGSVARLESAVDTRMHVLDGEQERLRARLSATDSAAEETATALQHDRAALEQTSERLVMEHAALSQQLRSVLAVEAVSASDFRTETVEEVAELLRRHAEMLRTEMAAVATGGGPGPD